MRVDPAPGAAGATDGARFELLQCWRLSIPMYYHVNLMVLFASDVSLENVDESQRFVDGQTGSRTVNNMQFLGF